MNPVGPSRKSRMIMVETPESAELEAQRAELQTLLGSKEFMRAPTLANLLSYLCERFFAGEANQIKEYSVGVEVFKRGASFDQDSDSIVRVEANRLRKRLAAYYAGDGATHRLQITIPVGQYVPRFEPGPGLQTECEAVPAVAAEQLPLASSSSVDTTQSPGAERSVRRGQHRVETMDNSRWPSSVVDWGGARGATHGSRICMVRNSASQTGANNR